VDLDMGRLGSKIRENRKRLDLTQSELAKILNISTSTIGMYEQGRRTPPIESLLKLSDIFGIDLTELTGNKLVSDDMVNPTMSFEGIPILGSIAAGSPILATQNIEGYFPMDFQSKADFALTIKGDSMIEAGIFEGDLVFIKRQAQLENKDIGAFLIDDEATLKRFYKDDKSITLIPANAKYDILRFSRKELEEDENHLKVLGKMVGLYSTKIR